MLAADPPDKDQGGAGCDAGRDGSPPPGWPWPWSAGPRPRRPETEAGDDGAAYGVEVRLPDGRQVEVNLDQSFKVVRQEPDEDKPGEGDGR
jgi:hypothetical protein